MTSPVLERRRGVTVDAPAAAVWPWVCRIRLAQYSYNWLDDLGRRSPRSLQGLAAPRPGEPFTCVGGRPAARRQLLTLEALAESRQRAFPNSTLVCG